MDQQWAYSLSIIHSRLQVKSRLTVMCTESALCELKFCHFLIVNSSAVIIKMKRRLWESVRIGIDISFCLSLSLSLSLFESVWVSVGSFVYSSSSFICSESRYLQYYFSFPLPFCVSPRIAIVFNSCPHWYSLSDPDGDWNFASALFLDWLCVTVPNPFCCFAPLVLFVVNWWSLVFHTMFPLSFCHRVWECISFFCKTR